MFEVAPDGSQVAIHSVGISVVEEPGFYGGLCAESFVDELGTESRSADADDEDVFEESALGWGDFAGVNFCREGFQRDDGFGDLSFDLVIRSKVGIAEPVVADHTLFIGVCDATGFEVFEMCKSGGDLIAHAGAELIGEIHAGEIQAEAEIGVAEKRLGIAVE